MNIIYFLFWLYFHHAVWTVDGQLYNEMDNVLEHLLNGSRYKKLLRPLLNQSHVIEVNVTQYMTTIEQFDISSGELDLSEHFQIAWTDELLTWDPSVYFGKETILLPRGKFWKPEILIKSGTADIPQITGGVLAPAWVSFQGTVVMISTCSFKIRCNIDTTLYPFDKHECTSLLFVSNHDSSELTLNSPTEFVDTRNLKINGEWEIENVVETIINKKDVNLHQYSIPMIRTSFTLKRRSLSAIISSHVPSKLLGILILSTCFIRPDTGERLSFSVTLYLAFVFATSSVIETVPNKSAKMPLISYFSLTLNIINAVTVTWSIFIVNLAKINVIRRKLPTLLKTVVFDNRQKSNLNDKRKPFSETEQPTSIRDISEKQKNEEREEDRAINVDVENDITGLELSFVLDRIFFWFLTSILSFLLIFVSAWLILLKAF